MKSVYPGVPNQQTPQLEPIDAFRNMVKILTKDATATITNATTNSITVARKGDTVTTTIWGSNAEMRAPYRLAALLDNLGSHVVTFGAVQDKEAQKKALIALRIPNDSLVWLKDLKDLRPAVLRATAALVGTAAFGPPAHEALLRTVALDLEHCLNAIGECCHRHVPLHEVLTPTT